MWSTPERRAIKVRPETSSVIPMRSFFVTCSLVAVALATAACNPSHPPALKPQALEPKALEPQTLEPQKLEQSSDEPSVQAPEVNVPEFNAPQFNAPEFEPLETQFPEAQFPEAQFPEVQFPEIKFPAVRVQENQELTVITLPGDVLFDFDKDNIRPDAEVALEQILQVLTRRYPTNTFQINGHTDAVADEAYNQELSERRANSVKQWLITKGVADTRIAAQGYGESHPVAPNTNADGSDNSTGRQKNRRVEIIINK